MQKFLVRHGPCTTGNRTYGTFMNFNWTLVIMANGSPVSITGLVTSLRYCVSAFATEMYYPVYEVRPRFPWYWPVSPFGLQSSRWEIITRPWKRLQYGCHFFFSVCIHGYFKADRIAASLCPFGLLINFLQRLFFLFFVRRKKNCDLLQFWWK